MRTAVKIATILRPRSSVSSGVAPENTVAPAWDNSPATVGVAKTITPGTWTGTPTPTITRKVQRNVSGMWTDVTTVTTSYTPVEADTGYALRVVETADNGVGSPVSANSTATDAVRLIIASASITPTLGAELITNGGFSAWTGDNPDGWTVNENAPISEITQRGAGEGHASTPGGTGLANIYRGDNSTVQLRQDVLTASEWYQFALDVDTAVSGSVLFRDGGSGISIVFSTTGSKLVTGRALNQQFQIRANVNPTDITVDNASAKAITLSTMFYALSSGFVPRVIKAGITRVANTQAGVAHRSDDSNFVVAYLDGGGNAVLLKRVGGTYTPVSTASVTYSAGAVLELNYDPTAKTYTVKYNGSTVINAASVTDAVFVTATGARLFSTFTSNSFADAEASPNPS